MYHICYIPHSYRSAYPNRDFASRSIPSTIRKIAASGTVVCALTVDSALRADEVCRITCDQARAPILVIHGKGDHSDRVFLTETTVELLRQLAGNRPDDAPLFRDCRGRRCSVVALRGILQRLAMRAEIMLPPRPLHAFRHSAAQQWVLAKLPDLAIRRLMRHESLDTTKIYTDQADEAGLAAVHAAASTIAGLLQSAQ